MPNDNATLFGSFVPTTNIWDVDQLYAVDVTSPEFKELLVRLYQNINLMAVVLNSKDSGYYATQEFVSGQLFFSNIAANSIASNANDFRQGLRIVVNFGALPDTAAKSVAHGIVFSSSTRFTRIYATATNPAAPAGIPIPYASPALANNIELSVDATNVTITTGSNRTAFTSCMVILEYVQF